MTAIGALFERDGEPVAKDDADRMVSSLRIHGERRQASRRFGNMSACWTQDEIYTAEDRFEDQPHDTARGGFVFSGRLDYRADLIRALGIDDIQAKVMPDSAVALAAWEAWGKDALHKLEGDWAFIALDTAEQKLFAARAPLMSPPLVYHDSPDRFAIASAPKGLFALPTVPREVDEQRVADALILNFEYAEKTYFKDIFSLQSGHWMEVTRGSKSFGCFYDGENIEPIRFARDDEYVEALDALMRDSVRNALRATKTPSCTVSAGLDSSTVAVYALEALGQGMDGLTDPLIGFTHVPGKDWDGRTYGKSRLGDESGPVKKLVEMYPQFDVTFVPSEGVPLDHTLDDVIRLSEMPPFGWNNIHWGAEISRLSKAAGRNVQLGGSSGNRTISFSNRNVFQKLFREGRWLEMHRLIRSLEWEQGMVKRYFRCVVTPLLPASVNKAIARMRGDLSHSGFTGFSPINPEYAQDMKVAERAEALGWDDSYTTMQSPQAQRRRMTFNGNREQGALTRMAMQAAYGIQARDPLGCRRITEFCFAIPDDQYMRPGVDRYLVRRLMKDRLPPEILHMKGRGRQSADWHARFTKDIDRYREEFEAAAEDPDMARRFDIPRIRKVFETWPDKTPIEANDHPDYLLANLGIGRMIGMKRFINFVEGKNR